ncbi:peptide deformylase [Neolewinella litorea]|uniref:Peptide deformylase n=1 Tax=Neolewinella litorea TaxID=2562452 RepID=A0A4V3XJZ2_9BACT|nr:peptide deformylase [Neolewinella litorea]THH34993.1 peptide deformylase [Neolewinella litorea]
MLIRYCSYLLSSLLMASCATPGRISGPRAVGTGFTPEQREMIMAAGADEPMRVWKITNYADSLLLRSQSEDVRVDDKDPVLQRFVSRLYATVTDSASLGLGIAAPQVGILKNIIWVQRLDKEDLPFEVYLNPRIRQYSEKKQLNREGCLSIPNRRDTCSRAYAILMEYDRLDGSHHVEMVEDFTSVIFQHEVDHLNGILFLDHLAAERKDAEHVPVGKE